MKCSESWLREWVNPALSRDELCKTLTMAGLEVEELVPVKDIEGEENSASNDYVIDISITPNRGDCLSVRGIAREVSALTQSPLLKKNTLAEVKATSKSSVDVNIEARDDCPVYVGRVIQNVKADAPTPGWLREKLRLSGIRSINPIVDVSNFVMLELGQPMHAFDLASIAEKIHVRHSKKGEQIRLLDSTEKILDAETLVIADAKKPLAIAGVMGGMDSGVTSLTKNIFLESAFFTPKVIARQRQYYAISTDSAYRFERGVDPSIQREALERATQLILEIAGGEAGPVTENIHQPFHSREITLTHEKIEKVLGISIQDHEVENIFRALLFQFERDKNDWMVTVPSWRFDISIPEDLIEEIARIHGYDNIPIHGLSGKLQTDYARDSEKDPGPLKQLLADLGYHEIISYSFVDHHLQGLLDPAQAPYELVNPITADMAVMRSNLWVGLLNALLYNKSRQQQRIRLFETGTCFIRQDGQLRQEPRLAGLITGFALPEQWGTPARQVDFYDLKGDIENMLHFLCASGKISFRAEKHPALHPQQTAGIYQDEVKIGVMGTLHPSIVPEVFIFEIALLPLKTAKTHRFEDISKFPEIRRDMALLINEAIPAREIQDTIKTIAGDWLKDVFIFDVYQGKGISPGLKSIAIGLVLQHPARTLVDDEVTALMEQVITALKGQLGAELRR